MTLRRQASGEFELAIAAGTAIGYFTPEGERRWAPGWDPSYPAGDVSEKPGTVFITRHGEIETVWVIEKIDRVQNTSAYSRVTVGHHAGTVRVRCQDQPSGGCRVIVEYDMTALAPDHAGVLDAYNDEHFEAMMEEWAARVTAAHGGG